LNKKYVIRVLLIVFFIVGGYKLYKYYTGNHIEVKEVFDSSQSLEKSGTLTPEQLDKKWFITDSSKVYFGVETSEESVYSQFQTISGFWNFDLLHPEKMSAQAQIDVMSEDSGNSGRDDYIKSSLSPGEASFTLQSFDQWQAEWNTGQPAKYSMTGLLKIAGKEKIVNFIGEVLYDGGLLKLKGDTTVKFSDFGLTNPHMITLQTQEDIKIILQLELSDKEPIPTPVPLTLIHNSEPTRHLRISYSLLCF
jgi:polyisoprenoid-binding protein YceI